MHAHECSAKGENMAHVISLVATKIIRHSLREQSRRIWSNAKAAWRKKTSIQNHSNLPDTIVNFYLGFNSIFWDIFSVSAISLDSTWFWPFSVVFGTDRSS